MPRSQQKAAEALDDFQETKSQARESKEDEMDSDSFLLFSVPRLARHPLPQPVKL